MEETTVSSDEKAGARRARIRPGQMVSHYEILGEIGRGGMGVVYRARDGRLEREVALKMLPEASSRTTEERERFIREAKSASALNHPAILTVHDIGSHAGELFIVTEFIEGETVREVLREKRVSVAEAVQIGIRVAEGLHHAHRAGIVHRDVKPENIIRTTDGRVKLMDFGLARNIKEGERLTTPDAIAGTTQYMSPEQIAGKPVDGRSDIFSLGVVLYELLAGRPPFEGEYDVAVLYAIANAQPPPLEELNPLLPPMLVQLIGRCLEKSPGLRFKDCGELVAMLNDVRLSGVTEATDRDSFAHGTGSHHATSRSGPLVGRSAELNRLRMSSKSVKEGEGRTLVIRGESGIGKTALVAAAADDARVQGLRVLWGRCLFQEPGLPFHAFAAAVKGSFEGAGGQVLESLVSRANAQGLNPAGRLPLIKMFLGLSAETPGAQNKEQLWDAILLLLKMLALERPVMLVLDDFQWADRATVGLFGYIARNINRIPLLLVAIYRPGSGPQERDVDASALNETVRQLRIDGLADDYEVTRLDRDATTACVGELLGDPSPPVELIDTLFAATDGNPLFVVELLGLLKSSGQLRNAGGRWELHPPGQEIALSGRVHDVILQRLGNLGQEDRELLEVASCEGEQFRSDVLVACLRHDRIAVLRRLQTLENSHRLIHHEKSRYRFDHPLVRQVLYTSIIDELREEYHRTIAAWLIERHDADPAEAPSIAFHLLASGQDEKALVYLMRSADRARTLCAPEDAALHYRRARAVLEKRTPPPIGELLLVEHGLGDIARTAGKIRDAVEAYSAMLELARRLRNRRDEAVALRKIADCLRILGEMARAWSMGQDALAVATAESDPSLRSECLDTLAAIHISRGEYARAAELSRDSLARAKTAADPLSAAVSLCNLGTAYLHQGSYAEAARTLEEARELQDYSGDRRGLATTLNFLALIYDRLARYSDALDACTASLEIKKSIADVAAVPGSLNTMGDIFRDAGDLHQAITYHTQSLDLARTHGNRGSECDNIRDLGVDYLQMGDMESAGRYLEEVLRLSQESGFVWYETRARISLGEFFLTKGDLEKSIAFSARGLELARQLDARELIVEAVWKRGLVLIRKEEIREGIAHLREGIKLAEESGHGIFLWQMYRDLGAALERTGDHEGALIASRESRRLADGIVGGLRTESLRASFLALVERL